MEKQSKEKNKATILQSLCYINNDMFVLATCGGKYHLIHFNDDEAIDVYPAASGMWLTTAFLNAEGKPTVALAAQKGNTQMISPGVKPKKIAIETAGTGPGKLGYLSNAFTYENEAYLSGSNHQLYVYREGEWRDVRPNLLKAIEENSYAEIRFRSTQDITFRNGKIVLLTNENIFEGDGNTWTKLFGNNHFNDLRYKSIAYLPSEESIYVSAGYKSLTKIDSKGETTDITIANRGTTEIWHIQPIGDKLYLEMSAPVVGGAKTMLLENDTLVDIGSPVGIAQNRRIHNVNGKFYFMGGKAGLFRYEDSEWIAIPLPEL